MADPTETKFKFEVKQEEQKTERKSTKLFGPGDSNVFRKALQDATKGSVADQGQQPMAEAVEQLHAIYISSVPESVLDKDLIMQHFSHFGKVKRVYISNVRKSAIVHFENHEVAKQAKTSGTYLKGHKLDVYWSKSAKVCSPGLKKSSPQSSPEAGPSAQIQPKATPSKVAEKRNVLPKYTVSDEVREELRAMAGGDDAKYEKRPRDQAKSTTVQVPVKQKAQVVTRLVTRSRVSTVRRNSAGTSPPAQQAAKPKVKTVPKQRTKSSEHPSLAESLLALTKQQALTAEDKYKILEARDKILRKLQSKRVMKRSPLIGTCLDMCPEKERYHREITNQVASYERLPSTEEVKMDHQRAVKQYSRSSADQDDTLCHELRPTAVLERSMDYLLVNVMDCQGRENNLQDWFHYLWDRTRSIRKDITQQELCDLHCVALLEQCARFHIHCAEQLVAEDPAVFDQKINTENLTKCLQTLKYMYNDMAVKGETCPCEAEFRAYMVLLNLNDSSFIWELKQVRRDILHSGEVQFALMVHAAIHSQNYVKFFKLVRQTTYLNACLLQRYFCQVRTSALLILCRTSCPGRARIQFPVAELMKLLAFENLLETYEFLSSCGLIEYEGEDRKYVVMFRGAVTVPKLPPQTYRAPDLIESKMTGSLAQVVYGGPQRAGSSEVQPVHSSFDEKGYLKLDALGIGDVGDSNLFRVPAGEAAPKRRKSLVAGVKSPKPGPVSDVKQGAKKPTSPDKLPQSQPPPAGSTPTDVKPITYSFAAAMGGLVTSVAFTKPIFSFSFAKPGEQTASTSSAAMEVDGVTTVSSVVAGKRGLSGENISSGMLRPSVKSPDNQSYSDNASRERSEVISRTRQVDISTRIPATSPDSSLQQVKSQVQSSKLAVSFSFDSSRSTGVSSQVPFLWKPKQEGVKQAGKIVSLETTGPSIGFSSSPSFVKKEQSASHDRFGEEQEERAKAIKKQQEAEEQKRILAEEHRKRLEEEKRVAAQKEFLMSQKAQKGLGMLLSEVTHDVCSASLKEMQCAAHAKKLLKEVLNCIVTENLADLMDKAVRDRRRLLLVRKVHLRKMRAAFKKWQIFAASRKKRREAAENFPPLTLLQSSPEDLYIPRPDQVALLQFPDHVLKDVSFSKMDICMLVGRRLLSRANSLEWNSPELFWKLVVSLPDNEESIYEREASLWTHQMFLGTQHAEPPRSRVTTVTSSYMVYSDIHLLNCVTCTIGSVGEEPLRGMNGVLFWVPSTMDNWGGVCLRLRRAVERREKLPRVPVAVVLVRNMARLTTGDVAKNVDLETLVSEGYVSEYVVKMPSHNTSEAICATVVAALQWLAERAPDPKPLVVQPLQYLLDQLVSKVLTQICSTAGDAVFASRVVQSPNNIIYLYNKVLCTLEDYLTDPELAKYNKGAPEFSSLSPQYEHLRPCPQDCGSPHYYNIIRKVLKKAKLSRIESWPPISVHELVQVLESYCKNNGLLDHWPLYSYLESAIEEYFELSGTPSDSSDWQDFLRSVNWVKVVEIIVCKKLESLQMLSNIKEHISVAISKKDLSNFLNTFWWFTSEEIDKVVETPFVDGSCVAAELQVEQPRDRKRRSALEDEVMDNSPKRQYKDMTREIDANLETLKSLNKEILMMLEKEQEMASASY